MKHLVIYSQPAWHEDAIIVGNEEGLLALKTAIENALLLGSSKDEIMLPMDGEGYSLKVVLTDEITIFRLPVPYYEDIAKEQDVICLNNLHKLLRSIK